MEDTAAYTGAARAAEAGLRRPGAVLMIQGTASDVGKSLVTAAIGRIMTRDGYRTAPFKSQNMALNSYVTADGKEIGRAQGMQAEAFGITATSDMNPILLKPSGEMSAQIVVHGVPHAALSAREYREKFLPEAKDTVMDALGRLREAYDIVLMEGAGSPAEINLKSRDIVNMNLAGWADAPVLLVADIDRGGVFAFIVGTLELLEPHERARVKGFIINKFRGDVSLLQPGLDWLEERTGIPVLGVLPFLPQLRIEAEDSVVLEGTSRRQRGSPRRSLISRSSVIRGSPTSPTSIRWRRSRMLPYVMCSRQMSLEHRMSLSCRARRIPLLTCTICASRVSLLQSSVRWSGERNSLPESAAGIRCWA